MDGRLGVFGAIQSRCGLHRGGFGCPAAHEQQNDHHGQEPAAHRGWTRLMAESSHPQEKSYMASGALADSFPVPSFLQ